MKIGIMLPLNEVSGAMPDWPEIRARALQAEEGGLDSIWVYDHLLFHFPNKDPERIWEAGTIWSALAAVTTRVELGALVMCTAFRNPGVLAKMAVTLDHISGGRIILGLGAGWHEPEFKAFGLPFDHLVDRFEEACEIIVPLVKQGGTNVTGTYVSAPDCAMLPAPEREIPVLIASFKPRMLGLTAKYADLWNTAWFGDVSAIAEARAAVEAACRDAGRDPSTLEITVGVSVSYEPGDTEIDSKKIIAGTTEEIADAFRRYRDAGVSHLICAVDPLTEQTLSNLAESIRLSR